MIESPPIIKEVGDILRKQLPRAKEDLEVYVIELLAKRVALAEATVDMGQLLAEKRKQMLWPKDAEIKLTDLDRNIHLEADVAAIERDYQFLLRLEKFIEQQLTMIIAVLKD